MRKILIVYGTRPEAVKMAPLIDALSRSAFCRPIVAVTGQHREMLDQVNRLFGIEPHHDLNIITQSQTLETITSRVLTGVSTVIDLERPDALLVQGDTTSCFAAGLASFYQRIPLIHLEAGLRSGDHTNPFPEEINRRLTTRLATLHLAPTRVSKQNLLNDGVPESQIVVTGNTVIDALLHVSGRNTAIENSDFGQATSKRTVLITAHRRESWGEPMKRTARAIACLARMFPTVNFLLPAHLNPAVRSVLLPPLEGLDNVTITQPLDYSDFVKAMRDCSIVLTDSGGVQEEAPSLGKPVLVMRDTTERPEAVEAGTVRLVGTDEDAIVTNVATLLTNRSAYRAMARAVNPYGDGRASERAVRAIEHFFGHAERPAEFGATLPAVGSRTRRAPTSAQQAPGNRPVVEPLTA
ncbi:UDP-N-acetylglucosamine 2-epimerase (non-hydrolyzing) [Rhizobium sp. 57MFTsu3.2]|uniref:non-hydrolyzing UDP-N-acetylglucosamine 2-epimerase n=1 Tax=Rhizobium sp. 57MFTsu3.2 TaxID=1048681 RepID=UPI00146AC105|nr:UDP-N-acetylglucosamine 2-epimerase (non-hydrolyzing) [Rhizobium sp. 57MFTsu3.2]NMN73135.1 UDP-N-acetylglucosamine 2-epimerase (non-hydrolysing) [Rhizobium sp. 57MFTsu3.2]